MATQHKHSTCGTIFLFRLQFLKNVLINKLLSCLFFVDPRIIETKSEFVRENLKRKINCFPPTHNVKRCSSSSMTAIFSSSRQNKKNVLFFFLKMLLNFLLNVFSYSFSVANYWAVTGEKLLHFLLSFFKLKVPHIFPIIIFPW